jgi:hypothetical protein
MNRGASKAGPGHLRVRSRHGDRLAAPTGCSFEAPYGLLRRGVRGRGERGEVSHTDLAADPDGTTFH